MGSLLLDLGSKCSGYQRWINFQEPLDRIVLLCYTDFRTIRFIRFVQYVKREETILESFFNLRAEKQEHIISAALTVFGRNGYKKASIADIAEEAGIAKGMVMYYFGSKKNLYLYLADLCGKIMIEEMEKGFDKSVTDFFDKLKMITDIKIAVIKRHPAVISFLTSLYYETHKDVRDEIKKFIDDSLNIRGRWVFDGTDVTKFKEDVDTKLLEKFLVWAGEGMADSIPMNKITDQIDEFVKDYNDCLDLMRRHFYKN